MQGKAPPTAAFGIATAMDAAVGFKTMLRDWIESDAPRRVLWMPVLVGIGIAGYFMLASEPPMAAGGVVLAVAGAVRWLVRRRRLAATLATIAIAVSVGFVAAQWRNARVAAPVLAERWGPAKMTGRVTAVELRPEGRRLILDRLEMAGLGAESTPARVRLKLSDGLRAPVPGDRIEIRAQLVPPPEPAAPGAYDFARAAWFERLGGVGSVRGEVRVLEAHDTPGWRLRLNAARTWLVARVLDLDPGPAGQVTAALLTGEMGHVAPEVMAQMRDSGLAHLLSISGLHISLVAGIVFFAVRRLASVVPSLVLRWPIKKIAALAAFVAISLYALFAAPGVPTTRAWVMGTIVLLAVVLDRTPLSIRLVAWAALGVLLLMPEALLGPSFQMSFAAVIALIAAFEWLAPRLTQWRADGGNVLRVAVGAVGMLATTLIASLATAPFALYHFNRLALLGILANLVAVPLTSILVMPAAVLVFLLLPFGAEGPALQVMNLGNELVMMTARIAASWPAASSLWPSMPDWGLAVTAIGGLWLCLWTRAWRMIGVPLIVVGLSSPWFAAQPDILLAADGRALALRRSDGAMVLRMAGRNDFLRELWLRRAGVDVAEPWNDRIDSSRAGCGADGCWIDRTEGLIAIVVAARALPDACAHATVLVTALEIWRPCPGPLWLVDRAALRIDGAHAIWFDAEGMPSIATVRGVRGARPWVRPSPSSAS